MRSDIRHHRTRDAVPLVRYNRRDGKISEIAVRETIHGRAVKNTDALANPQTLEGYRGLAGLDS